MNMSFVDLNLLEAHGMEMMMLIICMSFLLEDVALFGAALLAANGVLPLQEAWLAAFVGIVMGDIGVYWLARVGKFSSGTKKIAPPSSMTLIIARFTPGLRTLVYGWSDAAAMPFARFAKTVTVSTILWTVAVFAVIQVFGLKAEEWLGVYRWITVPMIVIFLWRWHRQRILNLPMETASNE